MATTVLTNKEKKETTEHKEGPVAKKIENQTAKLPSDTFLWASAGVMAASVVLKACRQNHLSLFVGQLAAPLLILGVYNKLVKLEGHDKSDKSDKHFISG
jgi:hypothetical protein